MLELNIFKGFSSMLGFVFATVLISSYYYGVFDCTKILVALATTLCPVLAITSTFGILSIIRMRTNTIMMIMPFLIMGIGKIRLGLRLRLMIKLMTGLGLRLRIMLKLRFRLMIKLMIGFGLRLRIKIMLKLRLMIKL
jgi:hypothetical protein